MSNDDFQNSMRAPDDEDELPNAKGSRININDLRSLENELTLIGLKRNTSASPRELTSLEYGILI